MACPASIAMTLPLTTVPSWGVSISKLSFNNASNSSIDVFWAMWSQFPLLAFILAKRLSPLVLGFIGQIDFSKRRRASCCLTLLNTLTFSRLLPFWQRPLSLVFIKDQGVSGYLIRMQMINSNSSNARLLTSHFAWPVFYILWTNGMKSPPIDRLADADRPHGRRLRRHPRSA